MIEEPPALIIRRNRPRPTEAQIAAFQGVPTGFVCDALGGGGALDKAIRPIGEGRDLRCMAAGPALCADNGPGDILATLGALDEVQPGDIVVAGFGGHQGCASAGDRVMGMLRNAGAAGFVSDGPMRDYDGIVAAGLPAWCTGLCPASPFSTGPGRVGGSVNIGGQSVASGDMIVGDRDGVVVVPFARIDEVIARLAEIIRLEEQLDAEVAQGLRSFGRLPAMLASGAAVIEDR
ncbi:RraA family protein [Aestuariicoccus sp. MJ-SS9]|uniref:RraA family protein n=1 Tax=Aestuariicoccus sp. MJ-SS9 TaxID=3079855 RepID=UPI00290E9AB1|nr:RraA family protein [Aestuariicoccus sp. MJ-SS9]MDU8909809.1 RraA family protein [Aestuariicoccus sp. MJ-SS9]